MPLKTQRAMEKAKMANKIRPPAKNGPLPSRMAKKTPKDIRKELMERKTRRMSNSGNNS